jgi:magnesium chelatase family protein
MIGGGAGTPRPGEVSLAHNGILFLDEFPEFPRDVLEILRQPLEDGSVTISRANMTFSFPSRVMLISAMNPCKCGFLGDSTRECRCKPGQIQHYLNKISGPLLDRIDIHVEVPAVPFKELRSESATTSSTEIRARVEQARLMQQARGYYNAYMPGRLVREVCTLDDAGERTLEMAVRRMGFSARAHDRILKVSRTIADLTGSLTVSAKHVAEAVQYRSLDRNYWT